MALILVYDAHSIVGLNDGDAVAQWDDSSGNAKHLTQGTAGSRPTYKTNILNGHPVVRFDGSADHLFLNTPGDQLRNVAGATIIVLAKSATNPTAQRTPFVVATGDGSFNTRFAVAEGSVSGQYRLATRRLDADSLDGRNGGTVSTTAFTTRSGRADYSAGTRDLRVDGTSVVSASGLATGNTSNTACGRLVMGQTSNLGGFFFDGDIAMVRVYDTYLSDSAVAAAEAEMLAAFGTAIPISLGGANAGGVSPRIGVGTNAAGGLAGGISPTVRVMVDGGGATAGGVPIATAPGTIEVVASDHELVTVTASDDLLVLVEAG